MSYFNIAKSFIKTFSNRIFKSHSPVMLGRWSLHENKNMALVIDYSNEDHCGNCGDYIKNKRTLNNYKNWNNNYKN